MLFIGAGFLCSDNDALDIFKGNKEALRPVSLSELKQAAPFENKNAEGVSEDGVSQDKPKSINDGRASNLHEGHRKSIRLDTISIQKNEFHNFITQFKVRFILTISCRN